VKTKILSTISVFAMIWGWGAVRYSPAQTRSEMPAEHATPGHQMNAPSDSGFHHRFEDAEKWAKEFDKPERDAWQKPDEILDALHLQRNSLVADIGAARVFQRADCKAHPGRQNICRRYRAGYGALPRRTSAT